MEIKWTDKVEPSLARPSNFDMSAVYHENSKIFPSFELDVGVSLNVNPLELKISTRGFKKFKNALKIPLPDLKDSEISLQNVLYERRSRRELSEKINFQELATILCQSLGITSIKHNEKNGIVQYLRAWPSAGGLYPLDVYLIAAKVEGLESGIYHYNIIENALEKIKSRSLDIILDEGFFRQEFITNASVTILFVACFERTKSKYGERGYRYVLLDTGHASQNILLTCEQLKINAVAIAGFCDDNLAKDLLIDGVNEAVVQCISLGKSQI
jgi:SagB-type dehydrogenase family enzyme